MGKISVNICAKLVAALLYLFTWSKNSEFIKNKMKNVSLSLIIPRRNKKTFIFSSLNVK